MPDFKTIDYRPGTVARVILNRPERLNAQSWTLLSEMEQAFNAAVADPECRVIVLSGAGRSFSAGHDLDSPEQTADRNERAADLEPWGRSGLSKDIYTDSHLRWRDLPKPTIAMVHGYCIYGGWMIASAMDFIFAADDALFIPTFGDYFTTSWDLGPRKAKEVLYENNFMTAQEALDWGFVNRTYEADSLEAETMKYAARVAEHDPFTTRIIKFQINQMMDGMGFSQSVRAVGASFIRRQQQQGQPQQQAAAPSGAANGAARPGDTQTSTRMRSQVARARRYLEEDARSKAR